jgi:hypothetical protein
MINRIKSDLRTLEWTDALELLSIGGFICSVFMLSIIWTGNLP